METVTRRFEKVGRKISKSGPCAKCGKRAKRTEEFFQTINPWNKNNDGMIKSRNEINDELRDNINAWVISPIYHQRCE